MKSNWLVSSGGRRGALVRILKSDVCNGGEVAVCDASRLSAAGHLADAFEIVPRISEPEFISSVLHFAKSVGTNFVLPTLDPELAVYARNRALFRESGIDVLVSSNEVTELSSDKWKFHVWLAAHGFPVIPTSEFTGRSIQTVNGPVVAKPRSGSSSIGVFFGEDFQSLPFDSMDSSYIVQEKVTGSEFTVDFAVSRQGLFLGAVPRKRLETRSGEVSKGVTRRVTAVEDLVAKLAETLPGAYGVLNVQLFFDEETCDTRIIELNARVGGGYPLSHRAGADFLSALAQPGKAMPIDSWRDRLLMLRYDEAVFVDEVGDAR